MNDTLIEQLAADLKQESLHAGRAVVLGIDGMPHSLLVKLMSSGVMPNMARLVEAGALGRMQSTLPCVSSVAWTSFRTGVNPGQHGLTGFTDRRPKSYKTYFPTTKDILIPTIEEYADNVGLKVFTMGMPVNYPPVRLKNGISIGCSLSPSVEQAVFPPEAFDDFKQSDYRLDVDVALATSDPPRFVEDVFQVTERYRQVVFKFWDRQKWDLMLIHFMSTDRLHQFMWDQYEDSAAPYHEDFLRLYARMDQIIAEIYDRLEEGTLFMMLSDHGFSGVKSEVNLNWWLQQEGMLRFQTGSPQSLEEIDGRSLAYSLIPGRFYINLKGREPRGSVEPGKDYEQVRLRIAEALLKLRNPHNGEAVIERVEMRETLYGENTCGVTPDLVALARPGYDLKDQVSGRELFKKSALKGIPTYEDAFLFVNKPLRLPEDIRIYDATNIVAEHCRCRGPKP